MDEAYHKRWRTFKTQPARELNEDEIQAILSELATTCDDRLFGIAGALIHHIAHLEQLLALRQLTRLTEELNLYDD